MTATLLRPDADWRGWDAEDKQRLADRLRLERDLRLQPKQALAEHLALEVDDLLYGGAAGGGKSWWLLAHVIREMAAHPGNRGLILRRVFPSLKRTVIPRARFLLHDRADYNATDHTFSFPNGSILELGHLQYEDSVLAYQGSEFGVIGFEELTEFLEPQHEYLRGRLRAPVEGVRPHMVANTNPGGPGHYWVRRRYNPRPEHLEPGQPQPQPFEPWTPAPAEYDPQPISRVFVPATLADNPILLARDPQYVHKLRSIRNAGLRRALEHGDWDAIEQVEGAQWSRGQLDATRVRTAPDLVRTVVAIDPSGGQGAGHDEQGIVAAGRGLDGHGYLLEDRSCSLAPNGWARRALELAVEVDADAVLWESNFGGDLVANTINGVMTGMLDAEELPRRFTLRKVTASKGKRLRAEPVAALYGEPETPASWAGSRVHHVGAFPDLEGQQTTWTEDSQDSPDRLDAAVMCLTDLLLAPTGRAFSRFRGPA